MEEKQVTAVEVVDIQFRPGQKVYYFAPGGLTVKQGDHVIIDTARGPEFGICAGGNHMIPERHGKNSGAEAGYAAGQRRVRL